MFNNIIHNQKTTTDDETTINPVKSIQTIVLIHIEEETTKAGHPQTQVTMVYALWFKRYRWTHPILHLLEQQIIYITPTPQNSEYTSTNNTNYYHLQHITHKLFTYYLFLLD
jgi:hypothetical protein